jgi:hypothetical protein
MKNRPDVGISGRFSREEVDILKKFVGTPKYEMSKDDNYITAETLGEMFNGKRLKQPSKLIHMAKVKLQDWHTIFAPPEVSDINQTQEVEIWEQPVLEVAAEDIPPPSFRHRSYAISSEMKRAHMGASIRQDFFKLNDGKKMMQKTLKVIVQATVIYMKLQVLAAVFASKQFWTEYHQKKSKEQVNGIIATRVERELFGILSTDPKGLSKLTMVARSIVKPENIDLSMAVFSEGTMDMISCHPFFTEAFRTSSELAMKTFGSNGKALVNLIDGLTVWEDPIWNVSNLPDKDMQQLVHSVTVGQFYITDNKNVRNIAPGDNFDYALGTSIPSAAVNAWKAQHIKHMARYSGVWGSDGKLSDIHRVVIQNLTSLLASTGLEIHDDLVDPYLWRTQARYLNGISPEGLGFKEIEEWGSAETAYFPLNKNIAIARAWKENHLERTLSRNDADDIEDYTKLTDSLANFDVLDANIQAYTWTVLTNPYNRTNVSSDYTTPNRFGSSELPSVRTVSIGGQSKKVMFNVDQNGNEKYTYIALANVSIDLNENGTYPKGTPLAFFRGELHTEAKSDDLITALGEEFPKVLSARKGAIQVVLATAPKKPYGYAAPPGISTLAELSEGNDSKGWDEVDPSSLERAGKDAPALNNFARVMKRTVVRCHLWDERYIPQFLKSGNAETDATHSAVANLMPKQRYSFVVREPVSDGNALYTLTFEDTTSADNTYTVNTITTSVAEAILKDMGYTFDNAADETATNVVNTSAKNAIIAAVQAIFSAKDQESSLREALFDSDRRKKIFDYYSTGTTTLGQAYTQIFEEKNSGTSAGSEFAYFFLGEIVPLVQGGEFDKAARLFYAVVSLAKNKIAQFGLDQDYIDELKNTSYPTKVGLSGKRSGYNRHEEAVDAIGDVSKIKTPSYRNIRLVVDDAQFKKIEDRIRNLKADDPMFIRAHACIIRPSDPTNPGRPLGPQRSDINDSKQSIKAWQFARAHKSRDEDPSVLGFFAQDTRGSKYQGEDTDDETVLTPFATKPPRISESMYGTPNGPAYTRVRYEDQFGNKVSSGQLPSFVEKTNLIKRMNAIDAALPQDHLTRMIAQVIAMGEVHLDNIDSMLDNEMQIPFGCYVSMNPWIRLRMGCALYADPGSETAILGHNYDDIILQLNGADRKWRLNYSNWIGCFIKDHRKFLIMPAVSHKGYIGGYDDVPFDGVNDFRFEKPTFNKSIFHADCGGNFGFGDIQEPLSLTMKPEPGFVNYKISSKSVNMTKQQLPCGIKLLAIYGFHKMNQNRTLSYETFKQQSSNNHVNTVLFSGPQRSYEIATREHTKEVIGNGHIARILPPELMSVLNGMSALKTQTLTTMKV